MQIGKKMAKSRGKALLKKMIIKEKKIKGGEKTEDKSFFQILSKKLYEVLGKVSGGVKFAHDFNSYQFVD